MPNLERQISKYNLKVPGNNDKTSNNEERKCNCKLKDNFTVSGTCLTKEVMYKATVKHNIKEMTYICSTAR